VGVKSQKSEDELRDKSVKVLEAKMLRAKRGEFPGGHVPFAMDVCNFTTSDLMADPFNARPNWRVQIVGRDMRVKLTPDGERKEYNGKRMFPASEADELLQLRPTLDPRLIQAVVEVFEKYDTEAITFGALADWLNQTGVPYSYADRWREYHIRSLLTNPIYTGRQSFNKTTQAAYTEFTGGQRRSVTKHQRGKRIESRHDEADWILSEPLFDPVVPPKLWAAVQKKLKASKKAPRAPKSPSLWLSGLLYCTTCGEKMRGILRKSGRAEYICSTYASHRKGEQGCVCGRNAVSHEKVVQHIERWMEDVGHDVKTLGASASTQMAPNAAFTNAVQRLARSWIAMSKRVGDTGETLDLRFMENGSQPLSGLSALYQSMFDAEKDDAQERYDELDRKHTNLTNGLVNLPPNSKAVAKVRAQLEQVEADMAALEPKLRNAANDLAEAAKDCQRLSAEWEAAVEAMNTESSDRQKAAALSKIVGRVNLTFEPTGEKYPTTRLVDISVVCGCGDAECPKSVAG
jgi:hypothetical protein